MEKMFQRNYGQGVKYSTRPTKLGSATLAANGLDHWSYYRNRLARVAYLPREKRNDGWTQGTQLCAKTADESSCG